MLREVAENGIGSHTALAAIVRRLAGAEAAQRFARGIAEAAA